MPSICTYWQSIRLLLKVTWTIETAALCATRRLDNGLPVSDSQYNDCLCTNYLLVSAESQTTDYKRFIRLVPLETLFAMFALMTVLWHRTVFIYNRKWLICILTWYIGVSGNVLIKKDGDRVNSYNVWNYDEGHDSYYASMLVDLTLPPDEVSGQWSVGGL